MQLWIPSISVKALLEGFANLGMDKSVLLEGTHLKESHLDEPYSAVPHEVFPHIWMQAFKLQPQANLPTKAALAIPFGAFDLLDHLVNTAETLSEGVHTLNVFLWLVAIDTWLEFSHTEESDYIWVFTETNNPIAEQWTLALILNRLKSRIEKFSIEEVYLTEVIPSVREQEEFEALWEAPVRFNQEKTGIKLDKAVWQAKNNLATPELKTTLATLAERVDIKQFTTAPLSYAIRARLPKALQENAFSSADIADVLGLSKRTLQRRLAAEEVSFKELLDVYREEKAIAMLKIGNTSMSDIAYSLGYEEQSSFNRAFRRWTGVSPSSWLKQNT